MKHFTKTDCLDDLRRRILSTDLKPGLDLDEAGLSGYYNMSRTPLREVLQRLQGEGYVVVSENRGAKVASMDIDVLRTFFQTPAWFLRVRQGDKTFGSCGYDQSATAQERLINRCLRPYHR